MTTEPRCWKKSSRSSTSTNCVEVAFVPGRTAVRDSKNPNGGHLTFGPTAFNAFLSSVKDGQLDG